MTKVMASNFVREQLKVKCQYRTYVVVVIKYHTLVAVRNSSVNVIAKQQGFAPAGGSHLRGKI